MKKSFAKLRPLGGLFLLFICVFFIYWLVATKGTFKISQDLDYFNLQAQAYLHGRIDLEKPIFTDELTLYRGKWYMYYGPIPALALVIGQFITGRVFLPTIYLNILLSSLNVTIIYLLLAQVRRDFFPYANSLVTLIGTLLFAFGTVHFWLAVHSGLWFVAQTHSFFLNALGLLFVLKKRPIWRDYMISLLLISLNFFGRTNSVLMASIPLYLYLWNLKHNKLSKKTTKKTLLILLPSSIFFICFLFFNQVRFSNPFETGLNLQKYHYHFIPRIVKARGWFSLHNIPENLWYMVLETPKLTLTENGIRLIHNPEGNSIFYLTPPFLAVFLSRPWKREKKRLIIDPLLTSLWIGLILTIIPTLTLSGTGWQQFGYRYSLDVMIPLLLLSLAGMKMRLNLLCCLGILFAVLVQTLGAFYA